MGRKDADGRHLHFPRSPAGSGAGGAHAYAVRESRRARYVRLEVSAEHGLVVIVPRGFKRREVPAVLAEHRAWIEKHLRRVERDRAGAPESRRSLPRRVALRAIAEDVPVEYRLTASRKVVAREHRDGRLVLSGAVRSRSACRAALRRWVARKAHQHLVPWLRLIARTMGLSFGRALVKNQRTRWGSCSCTDTISISQNLVFLPPRLVRYIFIHELCHTVHLTHSRRFWGTVAQFEPDYRRLEKELGDADGCVPPWAGPD